MVLKPCAAEKTIEGDSSKFEVESMEAASSVVLKPCAAGTTKEGDSSKFEEKAEPMEVSSGTVNSCPTKRKAEFDPEEEEIDCEIEEISEWKTKIDNSENDRKMLEAPEWDVDSFDGLEYCSSTEPDLSSDEKPFSDMEEREKDYRIFKRQIIESKGFYVDPELKPSYRYNLIYPISLEFDGGKGKTYGEYWEEMVHVCLQKHNQVKDCNLEFVEVVRGNHRGGARSQAYITFMAREKPDGPLVEYQAKAVRTLDGKTHPILCRPAPTPKP